MSENRRGGGFYDSHCRLYFRLTESRGPTPAMWNSTREDEYYLQFNDEEADTEDPGLSERRAVLDVVQTVAFKLLVPPIVAFGCVGNVINIVVLTRKSMKSSTNRYLTCLVVSSPHLSRRLRHTLPRLRFLDDPQALRQHRYATL